MRTQSISPRRSNNSGMLIGMNVGDTRSNASNNKKSGAKPQEYSAGRQATGQYTPQDIEKAKNLFQSNRSSHKPLDPKLRAPAYKTLSTEFDSFDMLWYDIETKARETVEDLNRPLLDKLVSNNDKIKQIFEVLEEKENRIDKLENIVL